MDESLRPSTLHMTAHTEQLCGLRERICEVAELCGQLLINYDKQVATLQHEMDYLRSAAGVVSEAELHHEAVIGKNFTTTGSTCREEENEAQEMLELPQALITHFEQEAEMRNALGLNKVKAVASLQNREFLCLKGFRPALHSAWKDLFDENQSEASLHYTGIAVLAKHLKGAKNNFLFNPSKPRKTIELGRDSMAAMEHVAGEFGTLARASWEFLALFFILFDGIVIPLRISFDPQATTAGRVLGNCALGFWTAHMVSHFIGLQRGKGTRCWRLIFLPARTYLFSWFLFDLTLVLVEYVSRATQSTRRQHLLMTVQLLRVLRIVRWIEEVDKIRKQIEGLCIYHGLEWVVYVQSFVSKLFVLFITVHWLSCAWHWIGRNTIVEEEKDSSWLEWIRDIHDPILRYELSLHWITGHLTGAPVDEGISPKNSAERAFTFALMVGSLLILGAFVSSVQSTLSNLSKLESDETETRRCLQRYLSRGSGVPLDMTLRIVSFAMCAYRRRRSATVDLSALDLVSPELLAEATVKQRQGDLITNAFFLLIREVDADVFNLTCNAMSVHTYEGQSNVFQEGSDATEMYYTTHGMFKLRPGDRSLAHREGFRQGFWQGDSPARSDSTIRKGVWLGELSLFMHYTHTDTLTSLTYTETMQIDMDTMLGCVKESPEAIALIYIYGTELVSIIEAQEGMTYIDEILPAVHAEMACEAATKLLRPSATEALDGVGVELPQADTGRFQELVGSLLQRNKGDEITSAAMLKTFPELDPDFGTYALAGQKDEAHRALCSVLCIVWILHDDYDRFTAGQPLDSRLTKKQWATLREILAGVNINADKLAALLVLLVIRGLGKSRALVDLLPDEYHSPEQSVLYVIDNGPPLLPSFFELSPDMQELVKNLLVLYDVFKFTQFCQGENLPAHVRDLNVCVDGFGQDTLKFYFAAMVGVFCGIQGAQRNDAALFVNASRCAPIICGIQCLARNVNSTPRDIYWGYVVGYARALGLSVESTDDMAIARLACLLRASTREDCILLDRTWAKLNIHDRSILITNLLADGIDQPALFFTFLPTYLENARKNPIIGLHRALLVLINLMELLQKELALGHPVVKVDLTPLCNWTRDAKDSRLFELCVERMSVTFADGEVCFEIRKDVTNATIGKLDDVSQRIKHLSREMHAISAHTRKRTTTSTTRFRPRPARQIPPDEAGEGEEDMVVI